MNENDNLIFSSDKKYAPYLPLFSRIDSMLKEKDIIVAIDGKSGSGKTTLSKMFEAVYGCTVIHMDDFFLRHEQRTKERDAEVGGNIDRERFLKEILNPLSKKEPIKYRRFNCHTMSIEPAIEISPKKLTLIEGVYSMHPCFADYYDLSVFLDVPPELQRERISLRNTPQLAQRFFNEWIPLENLYFKEMQVPERCDILFSQL